MSKQSFSWGVPCPQGLSLCFWVPCPTLAWLCFLLPSVHSLGKPGCNCTAWMYRALVHGLSFTGRAPSEQVRLGWELYGILTITGWCRFWEPCCSHSWESGARSSKPSLIGVILRNNRAYEWCQLFEKISSSFSFSYHHPPLPDDKTALLFEAYCKETKIIFMGLYSTRMFSLQFTFTGWAQSQVWI